MSKDTFAINTEKEKTPTTAHVIKPAPTGGEFDGRFHFKAPHELNAENISTVSELITLLERNPSIEIEARVMAVDPNTGKMGVKVVARDEFLEAVRGETKIPQTQFREAVDSFARDSGISSGMVGDDYVPMLGGNFFKSLPYWDFLKQANAAFYAWNHDPIAHQAINIIRDFTLGRGYRIDSENKAALALWAAFEKVNDIPQLMKQIAIEISIYGETLVWKLPNHQAAPVQARTEGQPIPRALIPRVQLVDPTVIWEVLTWPEQPNRPLSFVWVAPTMYQIYTGQEKSAHVPGSKFIFQTIPADQMRQYKINCVTGEKRGRSDLYPVLSYLKRLRDTVQYAIIGTQKQAAYSIDTTVEGGESDIAAYIEAQESMGTVHPAGSEFVHTAKVKREYLSADGARMGNNPTFDWVMSMVASGMGIPISFFGTHLSGGQTRASAIVSTEPVAKKFEARQQIYEKILNDLWDDLMEWAGLGSVPVEFTFPELYTQDRSQKFKDLALAESQGWLSKKRVAGMAAKELSITDYDFETEVEKDDQMDAEGLAPLTTPGAVQKPQATIGATERVEIKKQGGNQ
jgi:hypothetical protein